MFTIFESKSFFVSKLLQIVRDDVSKNHHHKTQKLVNIFQPTYFQCVFLSKNLQRIEKMLWKRHYTKASCLCSFGFENLITLHFVWKICLQRKMFDEGWNIENIILHNINTNNSNNGTVDGLFFYRPFERKISFPSFGWYFGFRTYLQRTSTSTSMFGRHRFSLHVSPFAYFATMKIQNVRYPLTVMWCFSFFIRTLKMALAHFRAMSRTYWRNNGKK